MYRPPAQPVQTDSDIFDQISELSDTHDSIIIGDFNLPVTEWGEPLTFHHGHDLYNNLKESALTQFVRNPTRGTHILDLVFTTNEELVKNLNVGEELGNSDHRAITFNINFINNVSKESKQKVLDYKKANFINSKIYLIRSTGVPYIPPQILMLNGSFS